MVLSMTKKELRAVKSIDCDRLFNAVWRDILQFNRDCDVDDIEALYEQIASSKVNNPKSSFYLYGK